MKYGPQAGVGLICAVIGFLVGREQMKHEIATTMAQAFSGLGNVFKPSKEEVKREETKKAEEAAFELKSRNQMNSYLKFVEVKDVEFDKFVPRFEKGEKLRFSGKIKNLGTNTISKIELTVYYLDAAGHPVGEFQTYPVLPSSGYDSSKWPPLKPNYETEILTSDDKIPPSWANKVDYKVTDLRFESTPNP